MDTNSYGAICGHNDDETNLGHNYYHGCTVASVANATGVGSHTADVTRDDGATLIDFEGDGTEDKPYIIRNLTRWKIFAYYVNNGEPLTGKHVKLTTNLTVPTMVGNSETNSFQGIFDGDGHTLTIDYKSSVPGPALFSYVKNATIKNLNVAGTITTSAQYAGAIVGQSYGSLNLTACRSSVTINSSVSGDGTHGGLVGILNGTGNTISGCVFNGSFATTNGTTGCGGFVGLASGSNTISITNSLISPVSVAAGMLDRPFVRGGSPSITKSYYCGIANQAVYQGTETIYVPNTPANLGNLVADNGLVKVYDNGIFYDGNYYITPVSISGDGTEGTPYIIDNADKWNTFAGYVANGKDTYNGKFVKLDADITVSKMEGSSEDHSFQGTFLGNDHTLTFNCGTAENQFNEASCAPFRYAKNATIRNLKVAGDIYTSKGGTAGFVSRTYGTTNISNCRSSIIIHSTFIHTTSSGPKYQAGFVAQVPPSNSSLNIDGCVFDGLIVTPLEDASPCSGFVDSNNGQHLNIRNSLYAPNLLASPERKIFYSYTFRVGYENVTLLDNYYTVKVYDNGYGGLPALADAPDNAICKKITVAGTTVYSPACTVSGVETSYILSEDPSITPVVKNAVENLVFGTDYTVTLDGAAVAEFPVTFTEGGIHTLNITGNGDYQGTENYTILVDETTLTTGTYTVSEDLTGDQRITISGDVVVNLAQGVVVHAQKGIELPAGSCLTINGAGALIIDDCDNGKSGIGAATMGTLVINGGQLTVTGGTDAPGIGSDTGAASGTLTIDYTNATDFIHCSSYAVSTLTLANGKRFILDDTKEVATAQNIGGKKIVPCPLGSAPDYPFTISTADEWDDFVAKVNSGTESGYKDKYVQLTADINVTTMAGSDASHVFRGSFDGGGHTLIVNYTTNERFCGPFRYTYGATIKNLKTKGNINTSSMNAGGVVGRNGTASITLENVSSSVTINTAVSGPGYHGGLVRYAINASFKHCSFTGKLLGADSHHIGELLGQKTDTEESNAAFTNCLFAPDEVNVHQTMSYTFAAGAQQFTTIANNCYYTQTRGSPQGVQVYTHPPTICSALSAA